MRWMLVAATIVMLAFLAIATVLQDATRAWSPVSVWLWLPMVIATSASPFARATWFTARGRGQYDEFERNALARATTRAFVTLCSGLTVALLILAVALHLHAIATITVGPRLLVMWATTILSLAFALPVLFAEFTVPMPHAEDQPL